MSNFQFNKYKFKKSNRLNKDGYKRPIQTTTDKLTIHEIKELLKGYTGVDNIGNVELGTHLRYFEIKDGNKKFRFGGYLAKNIMPKQNKYVVFNNDANGAGQTWSVQVKRAVFFRKMTRKELIEESEDIIKKLKNENGALKEKIRELRNRLRKC